MNRSYYKKLNTRFFFPDLWHKAESWRVNKKMCARIERRKLNREAKERIEEKDIV